MKFEIPDIPEFPKFPEFPKIVTILTPAQTERLVMAAEKFAEACELFVNKWSR